MPVLYAGAPTAMPSKSPGATVQYAILWEGYLGVDVIITSEWTIESEVPMPGDMEVSSHDFTADTTTVWLKGGVPGTTYRVVNTITMASTDPLGNPITDVRSMLITCEKK